MSLTKTEYLVVNSDTQFQVLVNDDVAINQVLFSLVAHLLSHSLEYSDTMNFA